MIDYKKIVKSIYPYLIPIAGFIIISFIYFSPVIEGKGLPQMDLTHAKGVSKELVDFKKNTGEDSQWTNSIFGGMPAYQIKGGSSNNIYLFIQRSLRLGLPFSTVAILYIYMLGFYLMLISLNVDRWISFLGALAYAFASYNIIIIGAGHITKTYAIGYMSVVVAGVLFTYNKHKLWGGLITAFGLGVSISTNHIQIIYYAALIVGIIIISKFIYSLIDKKIVDFAKATSILLIAAILAIAPNFKELITTYEYGQETIRGKSELTSNIQNKSTGLDKDYALAWSYGIGETFTLLIPNAKGGANGAIAQSEYALKNVDSNYKEYVSQSQHYWGNQPFTSGPVYFGAIVLFLFIMGLFIVEGKIKWWILAVTLLSLFLSWGKNFPAFTDFFFYNVPLYNKFRTVSMALVMAGLTVPLLGMITLKTILENPSIIKQKIKYIGVAFGLTGGLALIFYIAPAAFFDFITNAELQGLEAQKSKSPELAHQIKSFITNLENARISIFKSDAIRSFGFIVLAFALVLIYGYKKTIKKEYILTAFIIFIITDLWVIDKRYVNNGDFKKRTVIRNQFVKTKADAYILKDADPNYRVLSLLHSPFNDGYTPYFHKSIGGYHGAKLRRYQELIENYLGKEIQIVMTVLQKDPSELQKYLSNLKIIKYLIYGTDKYLLNWNSIGHAWFVDNYQIVDNADKEMAELANFNPEKTAIIDKRFDEVIKKLPKNEYLATDSGLIKLTSYKPNHLTYSTNTKKNKLAVFSEIYYDKGWNAYIDGKKTEHIRVNYVLRAMIVPKGKHKIEFKFEPESYKIGQMVSLSSSILVILLLLAMIAKTIYSNKKTESVSQN